MTSATNIRPFLRPDEIIQRLREVEELMRPFDRWVALQIAMLPAPLVMVWVATGRMEVAPLEIPPALQEVMEQLRAMREAALRQRGLLPQEG